MGERLYMIRINLENCLGPMTIKEVRTNYRKMLFGLQDEIAASNSPWIAFEDLEKIQKIYPELIEIVRKEMLSGWAVSEEFGKKISSSRNQREKKKAKQKSHFLFKTVFLGILAAIAFAGVWLGLNGGAPLKSYFFAKKDPSIEKVEEYYAAGKMVQVEAYIDRYTKQIVRSRDIVDWAPFLRLVAYGRDGQIDGLKNGVLRGNQPWFAPNDCSLEGWRGRWEKSKGEWNGFILGKELPKTKDWAKVLLWDPYWIIRRSHYADWRDPKSYYEACLRIAVKGLEAVSIAPTETELTENRKILLSRLNWLLILIAQTQTTNEFQMSGTLWALSCIESSERDKSSGECIASTDFSDEWKRYLAARRGLRESSLTLVKKKSLKGGEIDAFKQSIDTLSATDYVTGFDYQIELRFYQQIVLSNGNIGVAMEAMKVRYPAVAFSDYP